MTNTRPCFDCSEITTVVKVRKIYDDGKVRCQPCRKAHRERVIARARAFTEDHYPPGQNSGKQGGYG